MLPPNKVMSWDDYFINICNAVKLRSPDPSLSVGCVLVSIKNNLIINTGYNGIKRGISDNIDWSDREFIHSIILHAEINCLLSANNILNESLKMYINVSPCAQCVKLLASANVNKIIYINEYKDIEKVKELCKFYNIELIQHKQEKTITETPKVTKNDFTKKNFVNKNFINKLNNNIIVSITFIVLVGVQLSKFIA